MTLTVHAWFMNANPVLLCDTFYTPDNTVLFDHKFINPIQLTSTPIFKIAIHTSGNSATRPSCCWRSEPTTYNVEISLIDHVHNTFLLIYRQTSENRPPELRSSAIFDINYCVCTVTVFRMCIPDVALLTLLHCWLNAVNRQASKGLM